MAILEVVYADSVTLKAMKSEEKGLSDIFHWAGSLPLSRWNFESLHGEGSEHTELRLENSQVEFEDASKVKTTPSSKERTQIKC